MKHITYLVFSFVLFFSGCGLNIVQPPVLKNTHGKEDIFIKTNEASHSDAISTILITKNKEIITSSLDKSIRVWDEETLKEKRKILGQIGIEHLGKINVIALSPNEKYLAVGVYLPLPATAWDDPEHEPFLIEVFEYKSGKLIKNLYGHIDTATDLKFSDDGKYLVSSSYDNTVRVWDTKNFENIKAYGATTNEWIDNVDIVTLSNDHLIFFDTDYQLRKYSVNKGLINFTQLPYLVNRIKVLKKSKKIIVSFKSSSKKIYKNGHFSDELQMNDSIYILDYNFNILKEFRTGHINTKLTVNDDETLLAIGSTNETHQIDIYNLTTYSKLSSFKKHTAAISALAFTMNNNIVSASTRTNEIYRWNPKNNQIYTYAASHSKPKYDIAVNKQYLTWSFQENKHYINYQSFFDLDNFKVLNGLDSSQFKTLSYRHPIDSRISNGKYKLGFSKDTSRLHLNQNLNGENIFIYERDQTDGISHDTFGFYSQYLITGGQNGQLDILDFKGNFIATCIGHSGRVESFGVMNNIILVSASTDHTIKFWDLSKLNSAYQLLEPMATLFVSGTEWILWTPEGYFTASEKGSSLIGFHINSIKGIQEEAKWVSVDKLYDLFFRPDLIKLKLSGKDISKYTGGLTFRDVLKNPPPSVTIDPIAKNNIDQKNRTVKLSFNVQEIDNGGVGVIRIYQEGKLVKTIGEGKINREVANADAQLEEAKLNELSKQKQQEYLAQLETSVSKSVNGTLDDSELIGDVEVEEFNNKVGSYTITLPIKAGKNNIAIEAFNKTNTVASFRTSVDVDAKIKQREPKIYVIAAGVNEFEQNNVSTLKYSENDAISIAKEIKNSTQYKTEVTLLTGKDVTKEKIFEAVAKIKKKAHLEDKIVFYISTHGKAAKGRLYLVPQNNKRLKNWIDFEELFKEIQSVTALDQIFIIDACESGQASEIMSSVYDAKASVLAKQSGVHVLMATTKGTFAFESADKNTKHGVFTNNILRALDDRTTDKNKDKKISIIELSKTLQEPKYSQEHQFPIIRNVGEDTEIKQVQR